MKCPACYGVGWRVVDACALSEKCTRCGGTGRLPLGPGNYETQTKPGAFVSYEIQTIGPSATQRAQHRADMAEWWRGWRRLASMPA
jgi:hypothetical protein